MSIAELGVMLTGVNRAINEWVGNESAFVGKEPNAVVVQVTSVSEGSVVVDALLEFFNSQVAQPGFLQSMLANAGYEFLGKLSEQIRRALTRTKDPHVAPVRVEPTYIEEPTSPAKAPTMPPPLVAPSHKAPFEEDLPSKTISVEVSIDAGGITRTVSVKAIVPTDAARIAIDLR